MAYPQLSQTHLRKMTIGTVEWLTPAQHNWSHSLFKYRSLMNRLSSGLPTIRSRLLKFPAVIVGMPIDSALCLPQTSTC